VELQISGLFRRRQLNEIEEKVANRGGNNIDRLFCHSFCRTDDDR
jgi:hypothetical protein